MTEWPNIMSRRVVGILEHLRCNPPSHKRETPPTIIAAPQKKRKLDDNSAHVVSTVPRRMYPFRVCILDLEEHKELDSFPYNFPFSFPYGFPFDYSSDKWHWARIHKLSAEALSRVVRRFCTARDPLAIYGCLAPPSEFDYPLWDAIPFSDDRTIARCFNIDAYNPLTVVAFLKRRDNTPPRQEPPAAQPATPPESLPLTSPVPSATAATKHPAFVAKNGPAEPIEQEASTGEHRTHQEISTTLEEVLTAVEMSSGAVGTQGDANTLVRLEETIATPWEYILLITIAILWHVNRRVWD